MNDSLTENILESSKQVPENSALGLENIPIVDGEAPTANKVEFSYSTPKKISDLSPFLNKWSPKIHDVVSIVEEVINISNESDDDDHATVNAAKCNEVAPIDNVVYINEDAVKQEEFVDENSEESSDNGTVKHSEKSNEEVNMSFDENKVKQKFNITNDLCIRIEKIQNFDSKSFSDYHDLQPKRTTRSDALRKNRSFSFATEKSESLFQSHSKKSLKNQKNSKNDGRSGAASLSDETKRTNQQKRKQLNSLSHQKNKRQSLRLSGKSPEIKLIEELPYTTRSGRKRLYEEPKSKAVNGHLSRSNTKDQTSTNLVNGNVKREPENEIKSKIRSSSPSAYRKHIDFMYVCQCCDHKYLLLEQIKAHVRTHFPNIATD